MGQAVSTGWVQNRTLVDEYTGTGSQFDIDNLPFEPFMMFIITESTGELTIKTKKQTGSKLFLRKMFGANKWLKSYILTNDGVTFGTNKVTIGSSPYINASGETYTYVIFGK